MEFLKKLFGFLFSDEPEFARLDDAAMPQGAPAPPSYQQSQGATFGSSIEIHYTNYQGEAKTFIADRGSLELKGGHVSACVQPTGMRIALRRDRIGNLGEVEAAVGAGSDAADAPFVSPQPDAGAVAGSIQIGYTNYLGQQKVFVADPKSLRVKGAHISVCVQPTGIRIALKSKRIADRGAIGAIVASLPSSDEARVLRYHQRRGTTSPLYEQLRRVYPNH